jgi:flagellar hook assembly protein FlgD
LHANKPNPFKGTTSIPFELPRESQVKIEVFDLLGRKVATLASTQYPAGSHSVEWDMRGVDGGIVRPGIYVCRLAAGDFRARMKMTVLR